MKLSKVSSEKFEQQIKRIHKLIEQPGSTVTWNDHIPDPDNPEQPRQIDISIRRESNLTLVECRIHKKKQDVKWIEELIGRRSSLQAEAVIAVSASGFSEGAIKKAQAYGIILRDILSLTEEEIASWGKKTRVSIKFYKFTDIHLEFVFESGTFNRITIEDIRSYLSLNQGFIYTIIDAMAKRIKELNPKERYCIIKAALNYDHANIQINGSKLFAINYSSQFDTVSQNLRMPSVVVYDAPEIDALQRNVFVEAVELGKFEIVQSSNRVAVAVDISLITNPPNCHFQAIDFDFNRPVQMTNFTLLGEKKLPTITADLKFSIKSMAS